jgi:hypothetical protein
MQAEKWILETDEQGQLRGLPALPPHTSVEVILLFASPKPQTTLPKRQPPAELAGQVTILEDLLDPVAPAEEWDALK